MLSRVMEGALYEEHDEIAAAIYRPKQAMFADKKNGQMAAATTQGKVVPA